MANWPVKDAPRVLKYLKFYIPILIALHTKKKKPDLSTIMCTDATTTLVND
jgi:hypothetical protein